MKLKVDKESTRRIGGLFPTRLRSDFESMVEFIN